MEFSRAEEEIDKARFLDTGSSNHMTRDYPTFTELDKYSLRPII